MSKIVLTPEQAAIVDSADGCVRVCGPDGQILGWASLSMRKVAPKESVFTPEEVAEAERRADSPGPWYTTAEVLEHLNQATDK
jgi:hypothetical protein